MATSHTVWLSRGTSPLLPLSLSKGPTGPFGQNSHNIRSGLVRPDFFHLWQSLFEISGLCIPSELVLHLQAAPPIRQISKPGIVIMCGKTTSPSAMEISSDQQAAPPPFLAEAIDCPVGVAAFFPDDGNPLRFTKTQAFLASFLKSLNDRIFGRRWTVRHDECFALLGAAFGSPDFCLDD